MGYLWVYKSSKMRTSTPLDNSKLKPAITTEEMQQLKRAIMDASVAAVKAGFEPDSALVQALDRAVDIAYGVKYVIR